MDVHRERIAEMHYLSIASLLDPCLHGRVDALLKLNEQISGWSRTSRRWKKLVEYSPFSARDVANRDVLELDYVRPTSKPSPEIPRGPIGLAATARVNASIVADAEDIQPQGVVACQQK
jgi:hypothetical protein